MIDLCFMLADLGRPQYRIAAEAMLTSARACMEFVPVQLSDRESKPAPGVDLVVRDDVRRENVMIARAKLFRDYVKHASNNSVMCDADVAWQRDPSELFDGSFDVGVCWRSWHAAMPYYGGLILVRHGSEAALEFLNDWWFLIATMPPELQKWWGDQLSLAILLGRGKPNSLVNLNGCRVKVFDGADVMFQIADIEQKPPTNAYCVHRQGKVKAAMMARDAAA